MESVKEMLLDLEPCKLAAPRYLTGSTEHGSRLLQANPTSPLPNTEMIFLRTDALVQTWLMANPSNKALDLLAVEKCTDEDKVKAIPERSINHYLPDSCWDDDSDGEVEDGEDPSEDEGGGPSTAADKNGVGKGGKSGGKGGDQKGTKGKGKEVVSQGRGGLQLDSGSDAPGEDGFSGESETGETDQPSSENDGRHWEPYTPSRVHRHFVSLSVTPTAAQGEMTPSSMPAGSSCGTTAPMPFVLMPSVASVLGHSWVSVPLRLPDSPCAVAGLTVSRPGNTVTPFAPFMEWPTTPTPAAPSPVAAGQSDSAPCGPLVPIGLPFPVVTGPSVPLTSDSPTRIPERSVSAPLAPLLSAVSPSGVAGPSVSTPWVPSSCDASIARMPVLAPTMPSPSAVVAGPSGVAGTTISLPSLPLSSAESVVPRPSVVARTSVSAKSPVAGPSVSVPSAPSPATTTAVPGESVVTGPAVYASTLTPPPCDSAIPGLAVAAGLSVSAPSMLGKSVAERTVSMPSLPAGDYSVPGPSVSARSLRSPSIVSVLPRSSAGPTTRSRK